MAVATGNLVQMTVSGTPGQGSITLGSATPGFQSFDDAGIATGSTVSYAIRDNSAFEVGFGTYTASGTSLARTTVVESSTGDPENPRLNLTSEAIVSVTASKNAVFKSVQLSGGTGDEGTLSWNDSDRTLDLDQGGVTLQLGQEQHLMVRNATGSAIDNGTFLGFSGVTSGSNRIKAAPFDQTDPVNMDAHQLVGFATEDISNGVNGLVTSFGYVRGLDTRGNVESSLAVGDETWAKGDLLYVHPTEAGKVTNVAPTSDIKAAVAAVTNVDQDDGEIFVRVTPLDENAYQPKDDALSTYVSNELSDAELQQLQNIDASTISSTQWGYVGNLDQGLATTSDVTFGDATLGANSTVGGNAVLTTADVDDTPVDGETSAPVSSNWAYDHENSGSAHPITSISGLGTNVATFLGIPSSANLATAVTDETGSGSLVFGTSPTIDAPTITGAPTETIYSLTDAATVDVDPGNGGIQTLTLAGTERTLTFSSMVNGESVVLMINDGTDGTITTWNATFVNNNGAAPTLSTDGYTVVVVWKVDGTVYASLAGNA